MAIERLAYECEFRCKRKMVMLTKKAMEKHEARCFANPETKSCITCHYFNPLINGHDPEREVDKRNCEQHQDITDKLKTNCVVWREKEFDE